VLWTAELARTELQKLGVQTVYSNVFPEEVADYKGPADRVATSGAQQHYTPRMFIAAAGPDQGDSFTSAAGTGNADGMMVPGRLVPGSSSGRRATSGRSCRGAARGHYLGAEAESR
jgi:hypothetical protein